MKRRISLRTKNGAIRVTVLMDSGRRPLPLSAVEVDYARRALTARLQRAISKTPFFGGYPFEVVVS